VLSIVFLIAPLLFLGVACALCLYLISRRHQVAAVVLAPSLGSYLVGSGILGVAVLVALIILTTAVLGSPQGPLAILFTPWAFALGSAVGLVWWLQKHWSVPASADATASDSASPHRRASL
jgi:hypothetical protein